MRVHLVGIGGAGVSSLARVFLARGDEVSGCDLGRSATTDSLGEEGAQVLLGHDPTHVLGCDLVVHTGAARGPALAELEAARRAGIPTFTRAEMLARLIGEADAITVAGTHGKTTVTHMLGHVLAAAGWDPTVLVGDGASTRVGRSRWLVAEADESDGSLLLHRPRHGILTSVEFDHPDHFAGVEAVEALFRQHLACIPGLVVICADYPRAAAMPAGGHRVTYGLAEGADYRCLPADLPRFEIRRRGQPLVSVRLQVPGWHNRQNATGALAMAVELGVEAPLAAEALGTFRGARRRLERVGSWHGAAIYDDYGHHPTKVAATLDAARELGYRRLVLVFQPHRFTRFRALRDEFARSLRAADVVVVTEIYAAGEEDPGDLSARQLAALVPGARFAPDFAAVVDHLRQLVVEGDLVLFMGAGDIRRLADELAHQS